HRLHVRGVEQPHLHHLFQAVERWLPIRRRRLHRRNAHPGLDQPVPHHPQRSRHGLERPRFRAPPAFRAGDTYADRQRLLAHIQTGDPVEHDLHRVPPRSAPRGDLRLTASVRRDLCQDTDPRARSNNPAATEDPASYTSTGSPAPVCLDVAGRPPILIDQCSDSKSATDYTSCITGTYPLGADRQGDRVRLRWVVTMSIHKLSAGSGYDYLTRQVAALDATEKGHVGLASYYTDRGESPGSWVGSGMAGIDGGSAGGAGTAEQMKALVGGGIHPLATQRLEQLDTADLTDTNIRAATMLGAPFKVYAGEVSPFRVEVAKRIAAQQAAVGQLGDESISATDRARIRTEVAREFFRAEHSRDPIDAREITATIAKESRPRTQTVAGYDLTFSPVKSVSSLWAVADPYVAALIEQAHQ